MTGKTNRFLARAALPAAALLALASAAWCAEARRVRLESLDQIVEITAALRHTTVIALPAGEEIVDFVAGDTEYWQLQGEANIAYLKPQGRGERTNVALVTRSGAIYSFVCREGGGEPDLVVHVEVEPEEEPGGGKVGTPLARPAFVAAGEVDDYRAAAQDAVAEAARARQEAEAAVAEQVEAFRSSYPGMMRFEYRLDGKALRDPFSVVAMWNDGRHTYLRSTAPESPAIYEARDGKPSLVEYELSEDGLYVAQRVLRDGWLQIGKQRADWIYLPGPWSRLP